MFVDIRPIFSVLLTYSLKINSLLFLTHPACASSHDAVDRRIEARPSTSFVGNAFDLQWGNFYKSRVCGKVPEGSTLNFGDTQISLQYSVGQVEGSSQAKNEL